MKAIVQNRYGAPDQLEFKEVDRPSVRENDVLIEAYAAGLNAGDYFCVTGSPWLARFAVGFPKPKDYIVGMDVAGRVVEVGEKVTGFQAGDGVFAACDGALAEYVCADADKCALKPDNLTFEEAAAMPTAAITALQGVRDAGKVQPGQKVLINGAAGGVGTFAVQIAKAYGAEVTGVCSTRNLEMVRAIGADHVIDYTQEDFTQDERRYDLILDMVANRSFSDLRRALTPKGRIIPNSGHGGMSYVLKAFALSPFIHQVDSPLTTTMNGKDLAALGDLVESGKLRPVLDRTVPLREAPQAIAYIGEGHARGKVVVSIKSEPVH